MALGIVVVGGNMDPTDYYDKTTADKKFLTGITREQVTGALGYTPPKQDTTYSNATTSKDGLMSAADKKKMDGLSSSSVIYASGSNYVRFGDGTQICWGNLVDAVTFPVAFANTSYGVGISNNIVTSGNSSPYIARSSKLTTGMGVLFSVYGDSYIAIGRWK